LQLLGAAIIGPLALPLVQSLPIVGGQPIDAQEAASEPEDASPAAYAKMLAELEAAAVRQHYPLVGSTLAYTSAIQLSETKLAVYGYRSEHRLPGLVRFVSDIDEGDPTNGSKLLAIEHSDDGAAFCLIAAGRMSDELQRNISESAARRGQRQRRREARARRRQIAVGRM
jgi:hypothetical protein